MAIVKKYRSSVKSIDNPIPGVFTVTFQSLEKEYRFKPGQFLHLALDGYDPSMPWPESRCFSMQSSPGDGDIKITFAVKGVFTRRMAEELKAGKEVYLKLPYGDLFTLQRLLDGCVFIAGGTGITPYLSLFTDVAFKDFSNASLHFGIREDKYNIYGAEIDRAKGINSTFSVSIYDESVDGKLDIGKIQSQYGNDRVYFISGPPLMIKSFKEYLIDKGVNSDMVKTDDWE